MRPSPLVISLVPSRFEDGGWSGVPRFDWELRRAFPNLISMRSEGGLLWAWRRFRALRERDVVVITGNETSLIVPDNVRTIVMHHGCAQTHYDRDPGWRDRQAKRWCDAQRDMYSRPNRWFVAAARWTAQQFSAHYQIPEAPVIPNWVPLLEKVEDHRNPKPVILGDWRTFNKGSDTIDALRAAMPHVEIRVLGVDYEHRGEVYGRADAYLCLSLSEGGAYSVADAEAAALPLVTTDVGNCYEYAEAKVIPWQQRGNVALVAATIDEALSVPRGPSFFTDWTLEKWTASWHALVDEVASSPPREPLRPGGSR